MFGLKKQIILVFGFFVTSLAYASSTDSCARPDDTTFKAITSAANTWSSTINSRISGNYKSYKYRASCRVDYKDNQGTTLANCSGTLVEDETQSGKSFLTAGHCGLVKAPKTELSCLCGFDKDTKEPVYAKSSVSSIEIYPEYMKAAQYGTEGGGLSSAANDAAIGHLKSRPECPSQFSQITPMARPKDLNHAKALVRTGSCYFAGYGRDNDNKIGLPHTTAVPSNHRFDTLQFTADKQTFKNEFVYFINIPLLHDVADYMRQIAYLEKEYPIEHKLFKKHIAKTFEKDVAIARADINGKNGYEAGDSGGSLICKDKNNKSYLVGILANAFQVAILVNDHSIEKWLKSELKPEGFFEW